ncbi:Mss4-like protein [Cercophora newfieldiana]|uniref:Mss4-like protein n=1 Tax=Cercophora newfieldiana TaxID=92897 RepID=A0AA40CZN9_9PEZI|nr:Mss4-like protein [Cercophora newfieldiana]
MITISCLCGAARQILSPSPHDSNSITICHCDSCRHLTGLLFTTYAPIKGAPFLAGLTKYSPSASSTRYFCSICGCHIFRHNEHGWAVATGTITSSPPLDTPLTIQHQHISSTLDGGLSIWLPSSPSHPPTSEPTEELPSLPASCHCNRISFTITRPLRTSTLPHSPFADLLVPYCNNPHSVTSNPASIKWWLRDPSPAAQPPNTDALHHPSSEVLEGEKDEELSGYKYLAGTCACRSCRLTSGFEIQTWAFVPRVNILMNIPSSTGEGTSLESDAAKTVSVLDFSAIPSDLLKTYRSSAAAVREFCPTCGATVFWHDFERPDLIDVSVGLSRCLSGARAAPFFQWWTDRTSFAEEARTDRSGGMADWAEGIVKNMENGMRGDSH